MATRESRLGVQPGLKEIRLALTPDTDFKSIVATLEQLLTVKGPLQPHGGCGPCLSGLDRVIIDSTVIREIQ